MHVDLEHIASGLLVVDDSSHRVLYTRSFRLTPPDAPTAAVLTALIAHPRYRRIDRVQPVNPLVDTLIGPTDPDPADPPHLTHGPYTPAALTPEAFDYSREDALARFDLWWATGWPGRTPAQSVIATATAIRSYLEVAATVLLLRQPPPESQHEIAFLNDFFREIIAIDSGRVHAIIIDAD